MHVHEHVYFHGRLLCMKHIHICVYMCIYTYVNIPPVGPAFQGWRLESTVHTKQHGFLFMATALMFLNVIEAQQRDPLRPLKQFARRLTTSLRAKIPPPGCHARQALVELSFLSRRTFFRIPSISLPAWGLVGGWGWWGGGGGGGVSFQGLRHGALQMTGSKKLERKSSHQVPGAEGLKASRRASLTPNSTNA